MYINMQINLSFFHKPFFILGLQNERYVAGVHVLILTLACAVRVNQVHLMRIISILDKVQLSFSLFLFQH